MDLTWIERCNSQVARDVRDLLEEVLKEMDLLKDPIVISAFPKRVHETYSAEHTVHVIDEKSALAEMLVKRGALKAAQPFHDQRPYANPKRGIIILADRSDVELVLRAFKRPAGVGSAVARGAPPRSSLPKNQQDALPREPEPDPILAEVKKTHAVERAKLGYGIFSAVAIAVILAFLAFVFTPVGAWLKSVFTK